jgi:hypothetical protein
LRRICAVGHIHDSCAQIGRENIEEIQNNFSRVGNVSDKPRILFCIVPGLWG